MIRQGLELFDRLVVAIGQNPNKNYTFTTQERISSCVAFVLPEITNTSV